MRDADEPRTLAGDPERERRRFIRLAIIVISVLEAIVLIPVVIHLLRTWK